MILSYVCESYNKNNLARDFKVLINFNKDNYDA